MATKRSAVELDPDYEDVTEQQNKRQKTLENDAKAATVRRIENILRAEFNQEIQNREMAIDIIDQRLHTAQKTLDKLRACIVATYYGNSGQVPQGKNSSYNFPSIHPTIKKHIGKTVKRSASTSGTESTPSAVQEIVSSEETTTKVTEVSSRSNEEQVVKQPAISTATSPRRAAEEGNRSSRFKVKRRIIVGNVSKYIPVDRREENDQSTHKWMVYVRGPAGDPKIHHFVKKVWFFLHPSYRPNDLVEVSQSPFHLTRRGWGEFPIRVQLHFKDGRNKRVDILHQLKLDRTYTGLQTLGAETVVDVELEREAFSKEARSLPNKPELLKQLSLNHGSDQIKLPDKYSLSASSSASSSSATTESDPPTPASVLSLHQIINSRVIPKAHGSLDTASSSTTDSGVSDLSSCDSVSSSGVTIKHETPVKKTASAPAMLSMSGSLIGGLQRTPRSSPATSPRSLASPGSGSQGWTRLQIKNEPSSPKASTITTLGTILADPKLKNVSQTTFGNAVAKQDRTSVADNTINISGNCVPATMSKPTMQITFGGSKNATTSSQPNMSSALSAMLREPVTTKPSYSSVVKSAANASKVPQFVFKSEPSPVSKVKTPQANTVGGAVVDKVVSQPPATGAAGSAQSTVYVKCLDNQGKVYLIPQHLLVKSPVGGAGVQPAAKPQVTSLLAQNNNQSNTQVTSSAGQSIVKKARNTNQPLLLEQALKSPGGSTLLSSAISPRLMSPVNSPSHSHNKSLRMTSPSVATGNKQNVPATLVIAPQISKGKSLTNSAVRGKQAATAAQTLSAQIQLQTTTNSGKQTPLLQNVITLQGAALTQSQQAVASLSNKAASSVVVKPSASVNKVPVPSVTYRSTGGISLLANSSLPVNARPSQPVSGSSTTTAPLSIITQNVQVSKSSGTGSSLASLLIPITSPLLNPQVKPTPGQPPAPTAPLIIRQEKPTHNKTNKNAAITTTNPVSAMTTSQPLVTTNIGNQTFLLKLMPDQQQSVHNQSTSNQIMLMQNAGSAVSASTTPGGAVKSHTQTVFKHTQAEALAAAKAQVLKKQSAALANKTHNSSSDVSKTEESKRPMPEIRLDEMNSLECLVKAFVKQHPLVASNREKHVHPYCALSWEQFLSWNVGKRRAAEWQRACIVRRKVTQLVKSDKFHAECIWTTRQIVRWCREHWFTPLGPELKRKLNRPPPSGGEEKFSSYTDCEALLDGLSEASSANQQTEDGSDSEIDIISTVTPVIKKERKDLAAESETLSLVVAPLSPAAEFVRDTVQQIGIRLSPIELVPEVHSPAVEEVLLSATLSFMEDLLRNTTKQIYRENRNPEELYASDIYQGINTLPQCDFLTNCHLGRIADNQTASQNATNMASGMFQGSVT